MNVLLIDLGNTALKWCLPGDEDTPHTVVHRDRKGFLATLYKDWLTVKPDFALGCYVTAPDLALSATNFFNDHGVRWRWVRSQERFEATDYALLNCYEQSSQLGSDRWHAMIGAVDAYRGQSLLVVQMGTATTVDSVLYEDHNVYRFIGGRIAPGPTLMGQSLVHGIQSLHGALGAYASQPTKTMDAISTGIVDAQVGLVVQAYLQLRQISKKQVLVVLAGGAARVIYPYLQTAVPKLVVRHNLVLRGLSALVATEEFKGWS